MSYTNEQKRKLETATTDLMDAMGGKVPDIDTMKAMSMLSDVFLSGLQATVLNDKDMSEEEREAVIAAAKGAAFVAAIGRDESKPPFEYLTLMTNAIFGSTEESFAAKTSLYEGAIAAARSGKHITTLDTTGNLSTFDEGEE